MLEIKEKRFFKDSANYLDVRYTIFVNSGEDNITVTMSKSANISFIREHLPIAIKESIEDNYNNDIVLNKIMLGLIHCITNNTECYREDNLELYLYN